MTLETSSRLALRIGLPYGSKGVLFDEAMANGGKILLSAGSLRRKGKNGKYWSKIGDAAWLADASLDSAGFVAMLQGGYSWTVESYVDFVVRNGRGLDNNVVRDFPWTWWSAMDYCCEEEIASNRAEIERRIDLTISTYGETLEHLASWRHEGDTTTPDPMPILQGRTADDYVRCMHGLIKIIADLDTCTCPGRSLEDEGCLHVGPHHQGIAPCGTKVARAPLLPPLLGLGSVCRRELHGSEGLLTILEALDSELPEDVRLHLFGVKGDALPHIVHRFNHRVASIDSMAWDFRARKEARAAQISNTTEHRAYWMRHWVATQSSKVKSAPQLKLDPNRAREKA